MNFCDAHNLAEVMVTLRYRHSHTHTQILSKDQAQFLLGLILLAQISLQTVEPKLGVRFGSSPGSPGVLGRDNCGVTFYSIT